VPVAALNLVVGSCMLFTLLIYWLHLPLGALITYANGIFILIYLLCMLAGTRLLKGRSKWMAMLGAVLCCGLLAMVGWKALYAVVVFAALSLLLPRAKTVLNTQ
jgi:amino acid efflux transporter